MFRFECLHKSKRSNARVGRIHTAHGIIDTPGFVPVGTHGTIKAVDSSMVDDIGVQLMFCNTYHLMLHPGTEVVEQMGGLHNFMRRQGPLITDSGGFQVFSLAYGGVHAELKSAGQKRVHGSVLKITEEGVKFRSYRDGSPLLLTPESSVIAQKQLGADIIIPLDELPPYHIDKRSLRRSFDRTHRWQLRSWQQHQRDPRNQAMYGVVHGGIDNELRRLSVQELLNTGFDGLAVGGSLGRNRQEMVEMLANLTSVLPHAVPRHLLGIADVASVFATVGFGMDTFDSSYPTKAARHGHLIVPGQDDIKIERSCYRSDPRPIEEGCDCMTCRNYSRAYLHHLFKAHEVTALTLASVHNLRAMVRIFANIRAAILRDDI